jgi:hypothetical protein
VKGRRKEFKAQKSKSFRCDFYGDCRDDVMVDRSPALVVKAKAKAKVELVE